MTFHLLFIAVMLGLVMLAVWSDRRGYQQVREDLAAQLHYRLDLFMRDLASNDGRVVLANLDFGTEARELRPTQVSARTRVMRGMLPDEYVLGRACYLSFQAAGMETLNACAAVDHITSAVSSPGRYVYLIVRFDSSSIAPRASLGASVKSGDYFELEVQRSAGAAERWLLVLDPFSPQSLQDARGYARDGRVDPDSYQVTAYRADEQWNVSAAAAGHADHHVNGSFVSAPSSGSERMLSLAIDMTGLSTPTESWPIPGNSVLLRIAHLHGDADGANSALRGATFVQKQDQALDLTGTPLVSARALYTSTGLGETVELHRARATEPIWRGAYPAGPVVGGRSRVISGWRERWLDTSPIAASSNLADVPDYTVSATVPAAAAIAAWNVLAVRLGLSFMAMLLAIAVLYLVTMWAVLSRLMHLASAASSTATGEAQPYLPYGHSGDELGILSRTLSALIGQVRDEAARRERDSQERVKREYQTLRVIGHHIRSPIQALMALNPAPSRSAPYIDRINKAVQAVFGGDALRDAFSRMYGEVVRVDLNDFLGQLAANAAQIGIGDVVYSGPDMSVPVEVDDGALSDAIVQILNNAARFRQADTPIRLSLQVLDGKALIQIANTGPQIPPAHLEDVFEFGVSLSPGSADHQGQGLFVARELVMKMHGSISARNTNDGVMLELALPLARQ